MQNFKRPFSLMHPYFQKIGAASNLAYAPIPAIFLILKSGMRHSGRAAVSSVWRGNFSRSTWHSRHHHAKKREIGVFLHLIMLEHPRMTTYHLA